MMKSTKFKHVMISMMVAMIGLWLTGCSEDSLETSELQRALIAGQCEQLEEQFAECARSDSEGSYDGEGQGSYNGDGQGSYNSDGNYNCDGRFNSDGSYNSGGSYNGDGEGSYNSDGSYIGDGEGSYNSEGSYDSEECREMRQQIVECWTAVCGEENEYENEKRYNREYNQGTGQ